MLPLDNVGAEVRALIAAVAMAREITDMQDLMAVDPIHEIDESGWPNRREGAA